MKKGALLISSLLGVMLAFGSISITGCASRQEAGISVGSQDPTETFDWNTTIEKTVLIDIPEVTVTADSLSFKNDNAYLDITATNKTDSKISVSAGTLGFSGNYINNYMVTSGYLMLDLDPQQSETDDMYFNTEELMLFGIKQISEIGLGLNVQYDEISDDFTSSNFDTICQEITEIRTSAYESGETTANSYQSTLNNDALLSLVGAQLLAFDDKGGFDQNGISIKSVSLVKNKDEDISAFIEIQNDSDAIVMASASDVSINGVMAYEGSWTGETIAPHKIAVMDITLNDVVRDEEIDQFDLENVTNLGIEFAVKNKDSNTIVAPIELGFSF